jgi:hypothetical protein
MRKLNSGLLTLLLCTTLGAQEKSSARDMYFGGSRERRGRPCQPNPQPQNEWPTPLSCLRRRPWGRSRRSHQTAA